MRRVTTLATASVAVCVLAMSMAAPAGAMQPFHGTFDFTNSFTDTEVCAAEGFDVFVPVEHEYGFFDGFYDRQGQPLQGDRALQLRRDDYG
jgi:hypothetical protein